MTNLWSAQAVSMSGRKFSYAAGLGGDGLIFPVPLMPTVPPGLQSMAENSQSGTTKDRASLKIIVDSLDCYLWYLIRPGCTSHPSCSSTPQAEVFRSQSSTVRSLIISFLLAFQSFYFDENGSSSKLQTTISTRITLSKRIIELTRYCRIHRHIRFCLVLRCSRHLLVQVDHRGHGPRELPWLLIGMKAGLLRIFSWWAEWRRYRECEMRGLRGRRDLMMVIVSRSLGVEIDDLNSARVWSIDSSY